MSKNKAKSKKKLFAFDEDALLREIKSWDEADKAYRLQKKVPLFPDIPEIGFKQSDFIMSYMLFPQDVKKRLGYQRAKMKEQLTTTFPKGRKSWPRQISKAQYKVISEHLTAKTVATASQVVKSIRAGLTSAHSLEYMICAYNIEQNDKYQILGECQEAWEDFVWNTFYKSDTWQANTTKQMPTSSDTLTDNNHKFASVAHLWAAYYDKEGNKTGLLETDTNRFIAQANFIQQEAMKANAYEQLINEDSQRAKKGRAIKDVTSYEFHTVEDFSNFESSKLQPILGIDCLTDHERELHEGKIGPFAAYYEFPEITQADLAHLVSFNFSADKVKELEKRKKGKYKRAHSVTKKHQFKNDDKKKGKKK